jgi:signal transduction histidine kinase/ActR/RegA family two-component response regulator
MNLLVGITLAIAVLQLSLGLVLLGMVRAPEWRGVWPFSMIALSAGAFSLINVTFLTPGVSDGGIEIAVRLNFVVAAVHLAAWLVYAYTNDAGEIANIPAGVRRAIIGTLALGVLLGVTGWHFVPGAVQSVPMPGTAHEYRFLKFTVIGHLFGGWCLVVLALALWRFLQRLRREGKPVVGFAIGIGVFFACAVDEVLVLIGVIRFYSLADVGFLAVVVPVAGDIMRRFVNDARRLSDLTARLTGEVAERTSERDRAHGALVESERHAALGRLAAGVGHEINNPLTYLSLNLETIEQWASAGHAPADVREAVIAVRDGSHRISRVVEGLRTATRATAGRRAMLDPMTLCESALRVAGPQLRHVGQVQRQFDDVPYVLGDEAKLVQVLVNLLTNAANALSDAPLGRERRITVSTGTTPDGHATLAVTDTGVGIAEEDIARVTEPYFTTRAEAGGTGLGLFLARETVESHGGVLTIRSTQGVGTTMQLVLPPMTDAEAPSAARPSVPGTGSAVAAPAVAPVPLVLLVDDEPSVLRAFARALRDIAQVVSVRDGQAALQIINDGASPAAIVCDLMMPVMDGIALHGVLVAREHPVVSRMLFVTGGAVTEPARAFVARSDVRVLYKPLSAKELCDEVSAVLRTSPLHTVTAS